MHVCFGRPRTIRGINNRFLAKNTHILAHKYGYRKIHFQNTLLKK